MLSRQKQVIESLLRTRDFLRRRRPAEATPVWDALVRDFSALVDNILAFASEQSVGHRLERAGTAKIRHAVRVLRTHHLKPIVAIARACEADHPGISAGLCLPRRRLPVTKLLAESQAIRKDAASYRALMLSMGRPADFVEQLDEAIAHVARCVRERERGTSRHAGATAGLEQRIRRARLMVPVFDCQLAVLYKEDGMALGDWQAMKRVHTRPGPAVGGSSDDGAEPQLAVDAEVLPLRVQRVA
jgi:hypothetical protein